MYSRACTALGDMALNIGTQPRWFCSKFNARQFGCICLALSAIGILLSSMNLESWKDFPPWKIYSPIMRKTPAFNYSLFRNITVSTDLNPPLPTENATIVVDTLRYIVQGSASKDLPHPPLSTTHAPIVMGKLRDVVEGSASPDPPHPPLPNASTVVGNIRGLVEVSESKNPQLPPRPTANAPNVVGSTLSDIVDATSASTDATLPPLPTVNATNIIDTLRAIVARVPSKPLKDVFTYVTDLLCQQWNHNPTNAEYFNLKFQEKIKMSTHRNLMLTKKNTPRGSRITPLRVKDKKLKADNTIFKLLPKESLLPRPPYNECSVVGSSGILLGSQCGNEIDRADIVFRFNLAPTWRFETDVGGKTNMTTMNPSILQNMYGELKNRSDVARFAKWMRKQNGIVWSPAFAFPSNKPISLKAIKTGRAANSNLTFVFENVKHFKAVAKFWKDQTLPSTGFYFISAALALCTHVNVYGFWPFQLSTDGRAVEYHYYDDVELKIHDMSTEFRTIIGLHQLGLLRLHVGNCTTELP